MSIKKFDIKRDTTITNAFREGLSSRATDANMGLSDSLEVFFIYGQTLDPDADAEEKKEESRIILYPGLQNIWDYYGSFPQDSKFILRLFNAPHPFTLPRNFTLSLYSSTGPWGEGHGLDMESYADIGAPNWVDRTITQTWTSPGAVDKTDALALITSQSFDTGTEDIELDITSWVEDNWSGDSDLFFVLAFPNELTDDAQTTNFYTKKFFSRSSEFFFKRPAIEVRSDSSIKDRRGNFYMKSKVSDSNSQQVMIYNKVDGGLKNFTLPQGENVYVRLYSDETRQTLATLDPQVDFLSASNLETGIYSASVSLDEDITYLYDTWYVAPAGDSDPSLWEVVSEGVIEVQKRSSITSLSTSNYIVNIKNMKASYLSSESPIFRIYTRLKDWSPTIYKVASKEIETLSVDKMYYKIIRTVDDEVVVDYGIGAEGSNNDHTMTSYDKDGNYFGFDMSTLEPGYMYGIKLAIVSGTPGMSDFEVFEQPEIFKFRVD